MEYDKTKPLAFIHIPKTAGSSFRGILKQWFGEGVRYVYFNEKENLPPQKVELKDSSGKYLPDLCIAGHFNRKRSMGIEQCYPEIEQYITFLRDPFEVHLSDYFYVQKLAKENRAYRNGKLHPIIEQKMSLRDFLNTYRNSFFLNFLPADLNESNFREVLSSRFVHVGIVERFAQSIRVLAGRLGKEYVEIPHANKSERLETIENIEDCREKFYHNNALVKAIYDFVVDGMKNGGACEG